MGDFFQVLNHLFNTDMISLLYGILLVYSLKKLINYSLFIVCLLLM